MTLREITHSCRLKIFSGTISQGVPILGVSHSSNAKSELHTIKQHEFSFGTFLVSGSQSKKPYGRPDASAFSWAKPETVDAHVKLHCSERHQVKTVPFLKARFILSRRTPLLPSVGRLIDQ
jgi:hypothetical protein